MRCAPALARRATLHAAVRAAAPCCPGRAREHRGAAARRRIGWVSFWAQLALAVVSSVVIFFTVTTSSDPARPARRRRRPARPRRLPLRPPLRAQALRAMRGLPGGARTPACAPAVLFRTAGIRRAMPRG